MQTGIVGLPQVGKTTLFKILTKVHLDAKATQAAMHVGVARVPEPRIDKLAAVYRPKKVTHATVQYVDVGGLQKDRVRDAAEVRRRPRTAPWRGTLSSAGTPRPV